MTILMRLSIISAALATIWLAAQLHMLGPGTMLAACAAIGYAITEGY